MRIAKSFTIDPEVSDYIDLTKGDHSASDRVNELLRRGIAQEKSERLASEAAMFFSLESDHRTGTKAFQKAALRTFGRD